MLNRSSNFKLEDKLRLIGSIVSIKVAAFIFNQQKNLNK